MKDEGFVFGTKKGKRGKQLREEGEN